MTHARGSRKKQPARTTPADMTEVSVRESVAATGVNQDANRTRGLATLAAELDIVRLHVVTTSAWLRFVARESC